MEAENPPPQGIGLNDWWKVAFGVVCGLLGAGLILLAVQPPRGQSVILSPPPPAKPVVVHVVGAVVNPGVYTLPAGSRVQDAINAAGGLLPQADTSAINLAALLQDGERLVIPILAQVTPTPGEVDPDTRFSEPGGEKLININTATQAELESLPGIGPELAKAIIAFREANGPFTSIEQIVDVYGIGPKTFEKIKHLITV